MEYSNTYNDWKDAVDPLIRTCMRHYIQEHIIFMIGRHKLKVNCALSQKVIKIEEILLKILSLNFADYYDPNTLVERVELAIRAACIDNHTDRILSKLALKYDVSPEKYETLFHLYKIRALVLVLLENRVRQKDVENAKISERDYINLSQSICKEMSTIKKK